MREISSEAMQAILAQQTPKVFVPCLKIEHEDLPDNIRVCYDTVALVRSDGTYNPYPFQVTLPDQTQGQIPQASVTIDNTSLEINNAIRTLNGIPKVTMDVVLSDQPDTIEVGPFEFNLQSVQADANTIQSTLGYEDDIFSQQVPAQQYLPVNSPGLFA